MAHSKQFSNTWHPLKNRFGREWWYFTLFCDDSSIIAGSFCVYGGEKVNANLWLSLYLDDGTVKEFPGITAKQVKIEKGRVYIAIGENYFSEVDGEYRVLIQENDFSLRFTGRSVVNWKENVISLAFDKENTVRWIVPVLKGNFEGEMVLQGKERKIKGIFFHDHVLVNVQPLLLLQMKGWTWGISSCEKDSLLFVKVDLKKKPFHFVCIEDKGKIITPREYKIKVFKNGVKVLLPKKEYTFSFDSVHRVPSYRGRNWLASAALQFLKIKKYHAFSKERMNYVEFLRW